jgi:hypothetical protein
MYKLEIATCELAKKANTLPQLQACLVLLDKAQARADKGNQIGQALASDTESLQASASAHNKRCPLQQIQVVKQ